MILCDPDKITCTVALDGSNITFFPCGTISHHPKDIAERYCARCHRFMDLIEIAREITREVRS